MLAERKQENLYGGSNVYDYWWFLNSKLIIKWILSPFF